MMSEKKLSEEGTSHLTPARGGSERRNVVGTGKSRY